MIKNNETNILLLQYFLFDFFYIVTYGIHLFQGQAELTLRQYQQWMSVANKEVKEITQQLEALEKTLHCPDAMLQLRTELTNLKNKVGFSILYVYNYMVCN